jgi:hypothetical protein
MSVWCRILGSSADISAATFSSKLYSVSSQKGGKLFSGRESASERTLRRWTLNSDRRAQLKGELGAIELWDLHYFGTVHDKKAEDAFRARQDRRKQLLGEMMLIDTDAQVFRLSFRRLT